MINTIVTMSPLDELKTRIAKEGEPLRRIEALILALADAIKATSNDQNVQRLSRELRAAVSDLASTVSSTS